MTDKAIGRQYADFAKVRAEEAYRQEQAEQVDIIVYEREVAQLVKKGGPLLDSKRARLRYGVKPFLWQFLCNASKAMKSHKLYDPRAPRTYTKSDKFGITRGH